MSRTSLRLLRLTAPAAGAMALAVLLSAAALGSGLGLMATSAYLISAAALRPSIADLSLAIVGVRAFGLARAGFRYLERLVAHSANLRLVAALRVWFYRAAEPLAPARLLDRRGGDLLGRAVGDLEALHEFFARALAPPAAALLVGGAVLLALSAQHLVLGAAFAVGLAAGGILLPAAARAISRGPSVALAARRADLQAEVVELLQGLPDLTAFGATDPARRRVQEHQRAFDAAQLRLTWAQAAQSALGGLNAHLAAAAVLAVGVSLLEAGRVQGVHLAALVLGTLAAYEAITPLPAAAQAFESARAAAARLFEISDTPAAVREPMAPVAPRGSPPSIEARALRFAYAPNESPALDGLDLAVPAGARVAVVGPSGSGKTTLLRLLLRFWEHEQGELLLDGLDVRTLSGEALRAAAAVVPQDSYVFSGTLRENLLLADPEASSDVLLEAAQAAGLGEWIDSQALGLEASVGEGGRRLSGGERQKLVIARALLRPAPLLVLDEPTAGLDPRAERRAVEALHRAAHRRTCLWITHRLVGMERMDQIVVLARGRVVERGRHAELLARRGLYARLWDIQRRAWTALDSPPAAPEAARPHRSDT